MVKPGEVEGIVELPVKPRKAGKVPNVIVTRRSREEKRMAWIEVSDVAGRAEVGCCPKCGKPREPKTVYCWYCGAKLD